MNRRLVVNADDFGMTVKVNEGILAAHRAGIVRSTSLMANGEAFSHALEAARQTPSLDVGCHLVLTSGNSVASPGKPLPASLRDLLQSTVTRRFCPVDEMSAQTEKVLSAGLRISHLDTHKGVHLIPALMEAIARVAERYRIPWVRIPLDFGWRRERSGRKAAVTYRTVAVIGEHLKRKLQAHGCRTTDHFTGLHMIGKFGATDLAALFQELPQGSTELMCHPGYCSEELTAAGTHVTFGREYELAALTAAETKAAAAVNGIEIVGYREL